MPRAAAAVVPRPVAATSAALFDRLLGDLIAGRYPPGAHLPPERELSRMLGASRPTLREALRRLGEWGLVEARRGSGVAVRPPCEWSIDVLPAFLRHGLSGGGLAASGPGAGFAPETLPTVVRDLFALRRALVVEVLRVVGSRFSPGSLDGARAAVERAYAARGDAGAFVREDLAAMRAIVEAAGFLPAVWMLNGLSSVYGELARTLTTLPSGGTKRSSEVPADYRRSLGAVFDALERGHTERACRAMGAYLARHDRRLTLALGIAP